MTFSSGVSKSPFIKLAEVPRARQVQIDVTCGTVSSVVVGMAGSSIRGPLKQVSTTPSVWSSNVPGKALDLTEVQVILKVPPQGECTIRVFVKR